MAAAPILVKEGDKVWLRNGTLGYVHEIHKPPQGFRLFDLMDLNRRLIKGVKRPDVVVDDPEMLTLDQQILDQLLESFDADEPMTCESPSLFADTTCTLAPQPLNPSTGLNVSGIDDNVNESTAPKEKISRFKTVTEETLDQLANSTTAKTTDYQTKWAVKTLKGRYYTE
jgi:hypothetical protein